LLPDSDYTNATALIRKLKNSFIQQTMVEEIQHVNMHLNVPYESNIDNYTYFKIIPYVAITYEETSQ
jgi:hypothetical protein